MNKQKQKPQETFEFRTDKKMETFSFNPPTNLPEEGKWFLAVTSFEATIPIFNITKENKSFSILTPGHWNPEAGGEFISPLNKLLELKSENDTKLTVKEIGKRCTQRIIGNSGYNLAGFDHFKNEILAELK